MSNRGEVVDKEDGSSVISLLEEKGKRNYELAGKIKKLSMNLNESEMEEFIIDRSKSLMKLKSKSTDRQGIFRN